jgi:hypothetical protein
MSEGLVGGEGFAIDASVIKADANRARGVPGSETADWRKDAAASRAVREYLDALEEINPTSDDEGGSPQPPSAGKNVSLTDPAARWTAAPGGPAFYAYSTNYLIDLDAGIIVDVEATPAHRTQEVESTKTMIERVEQRFGLKPDRLVGDTAYGTAPMLGWMVQDKGIEPHVPVWDKTERKDGTLSSSEFVWNEQSTKEANWGRKLPSGQGLGLAAHYSFVAYMAAVIEVAVAPNGELTIPRIDIAVDCGPQVNPDRVRSQMEGACVMGLSQAVVSEITFKNGRAQQDNFHQYEIVRMNTAPKRIAVHMIPADSYDMPLGGVGEPGVPVIAPALMNAINAATGKRIRRLPLRDQLSAPI